MKQSAVTLGRPPALALALARAGSQPLALALLALAGCGVKLPASAGIPDRVASGDPVTLGSEPAESHVTRPQCTVRARMWTKAPTGFMIAEATTSLDTAAAGDTPNSRTSIGVTSAAPPIPVRPTMRPATSPPSDRARSMSENVTGTR